MTLSSPTLFASRLSLCFSAFHLLLGYSGVATYVKAGLTKRADSKPFRKFISAQLAEPNSAISSDEGPKLAASPHAFLDWEGRVVVTEQSRFVLFNVYVPNSGRTCERLSYKMHFLHALRAAMWRER